VLFSRLGGGIAALWFCLGSVVGIRGMAGTGWGAQGLGEVPGCSGSLTAWVRHGVGASSLHQPSLHWPHTSLGNNRLHAGSKLRRVDELASDLVVALCSGAELAHPVVESLQVYTPSHEGVVLV